MNRFERILHERILPKPSWERNRDLNQTVILAGSGRSGTSWLAEYLRRSGSFRYLWEPFHTGRVPGAKQHLGPSPYLPPNADRPQAEQFVETVLRGQIKSPWIDSRQRGIIFDRRLVKTIRANLMLKWLKGLFPEVRCLLLLRHPYAVSQSRVRLGWDARLSDFLNQERLIEEHLHPFLPVLERAQDAWDRQIIRWCVETLVPLRELERGDVELIFYEDLVRNYPESLEQTVQRMGYPPSKHQGRAYQRSSSSKMGLGGAQQGLEQWQGTVEDKAMQRVQHYLELFGLEAVYGSEALPRKREGSSLLQLFASGSGP